MAENTDLQTIQAFTKGLGSLGDFMSYRGLAQGKDLQAGLLDIEAGSIVESGKSKAEIMRQQGNAFLARQKAVYAKAGVTFEGSPADTFRQTEKNISRDILTTRLNAAKDANRVRMYALQERIAAGQARTRSIQALGQGVLNMASAYATK